jgi:cell division protein FtsW (lipid II flippase)
MMKTKILFIFTIVLLISVIAVSISLIVKSSSNDNDKFRNDSRKIGQTVSSIIGTLLFICISILIYNKVGMSILYLFITSCIILVTTLAMWFNASSETPLEYKNNARNTSCAMIVFSLIILSILIWSFVKHP